MMEMLLSWIVVMLSQLYEFTKNPWIVYLKWVNFLAWKINLNKALPYAFCKT